MSEKDNVQEFKLSGPQLSVAGQMLGYSHLLLPKDPFAGWLVEEIEEGVGQAQEELNDSGLIKLTDAQAVDVDEGLFKAITALGNPEFSLMLNRSTPDEGAHSRYFYFAEDIWVSLEQGGDQCHLIILGGSTQLAEHVFAFVNLQDQPAGPGEKIHLSAEDYQEGGSLARSQGAETCEKFLEKAGVSKGTPLANALTQPVASGSLIALGWEGRQSRQIDGFAFLESEKGLWQIMPKPDQPDWIVVKPISGEGFIENVEAILANLNTN